MRKITIKWLKQAEADFKELAIHPCALGTGFLTESFKDNRYFFDLAVVINGVEK